MSYISCSWAEFKLLDFRNFCWDINDQLSDVWWRFITQMHLWSSDSYNSVKVNGSIDGLQHKGTMSTKPVFEKNCKDTKVVYPIMWTYNICAFDTDKTMTIIDKITIFCNDVSKASTSIELLTINILCYVS